MLTVPQRPRHPARALAADGTARDSHELAGFAVDSDGGCDSGLGLGVGSLRVWVSFLLNNALARPTQFWEAIRPTSSQPPPQHLPFFLPCALSNAVRARARPPWAAKLASRLHLTPQPRRDGLRQLQLRLLPEGEPDSDAASGPYVHSPPGRMTRGDRRERERGRGGEEREEKRVQARE